jgi:hypothetical protein
MGKWCPVVGEGIKPNLKWRNSPMGIAPQRTKDTRGMGLNNRGITSQDKTIPYAVQEVNTFFYLGSHPLMGLGSLNFIS